MGDGGEGYRSYIVSHRGIRGGGNRCRNGTRRPKRLEIRGQRQMALLEAALDDARRERRSPMRCEAERRKIVGLFKLSKRSTQQQQQQQQWTRRRASWTVCLTDRGGGVDGGGGFSQLLADKQPEAGDARGSIGRWVGLPRTSCSSRS